MRTRRLSIALVTAAVVLLTLAGCFQSAEQIAMGRLRDRVDAFSAFLAEQFDDVMSADEATAKFGRIGKKLGIVLDDYPADVTPSTIVSHVYDIDRDGSALEFGVSLFAQSEIGGGWTADSARLFTCVRFSVVGTDVTLANDDCPERILNDHAPGGRVRLADIGR